MEITLQNNMFVLAGNGGSSCLGFDVVFGRLKELSKRLTKAGLTTCGAPSAKQKGTIEQYQAYQAAMRLYMTMNDTQTWFESETPYKVRTILERYRRSGKEIRIFYGNPKTGCDLLEEFDTVGTIGRSSGAMKVPLLVIDELGGSAISTKNIVRLMDVASGNELYRCKNYHQPAIQVGDADCEDERYNYGVWVEYDGVKTIHSNHKSLPQAVLCASFLRGDQVAPYR